MSCIIHYHQYSSDEKLVFVTEKTFVTLVECKSIRESLGGDNHHIEQCDLIPETFNQELKISSTMLTKIYICQNFSQKETIKRTKAEATTSNRVVACRMFCENVCITVNKKEQYPKRIESKLAENSVHTSANLRSDFTMLGMIDGIDLIADTSQTMSNPTKYLRDNQLLKS